MPYYDYKCDDCQSTVEVKLSLAQKESGVEVECPECHSRNTHQLFAAVAVGSADRLPERSFESKGPCGSACGCFPQN
ncbi:MAG TPA: zinc ribbon domain-containing protein [Leptospiraceae bacterium]|nr:FmdB family transcriptional regulator [Spirochaetaceae bacterium]HBS06836.1 zinc ribbon domain-containing protein [Leptospiraceae bacterium]